MPAPAGRRRLRLALKGFGLALLVLVGLVAIASRVADTSWGRERIRQLLVAEINSRIRGTLSVASLQGSLYGPSVLRQVELRDPQGRPVVEVAAVVLDYSFWQLLFGELRIDSVRLLSAQITLAPTRSGQLNLVAALAPARPTPPGGPPSDLQLAITALEVRGGRLSLALGDGRTLELGGLGAVARIELHGPLARIQLKRASGRWEQTGLAFTLAAGLTIGPEVLSAEELALGVGQSRLEIASAELRPGSGRLQADFELALAPAELRRLVPGIEPDVGLQVGGHLEHTPGLAGVLVDLSGTLAGARLAFDGRFDPAGPAVTGKLELSGLDPAAIFRAAPSGALELSIEAALSRLALAELTGRLQATASGRIAEFALRSARLQAKAEDGLASGRLSLAGPTGWVETSASLRLGEKVAIESAELQAGLSDLSDLSDVGLALPWLAGASGSLKVQARASGALDAIATSGSFQASDLRRGEISAHSASGRFRLEGLPRSVQGEASLRTARLVLGRQWSGPVSARVVAASTGGRFEVSLAAGAPDAPLSLSTDLVLFSQAGAIEARLQRLRLGLGGTVWSGRQGGLSWRDNALEVRDLVLRSAHGRLSLSGRLSHGAVSELRLVASGLDLAGMARASGLASLAGLRGRVDLELDASSTAAGRPRVAARLSAAAVGWSPDGPSIDGRLQADLVGARLELSGRAHSGAVGGARFELTVRAPARPLSPRSWVSLNPTALLTARVDLQQLDLAGLAAGSVPLQGRLSGQVELDRRAGRARLGLQLTDGSIPTWDLPLSASLEARLNERQLDFDGQAQAGELGELQLSAAARLPGGPEEPATWRGLGLGDLQRARLTWREVGLAALEKRLPPEWAAILPRLVGRVRLQVELADQARQASVEVDLEQVLVADLQTPIDAQLKLTASKARTRGRLESSLRGLPFIQADFELGLGLDGLLGPLPPPLASVAMRGQLDLMALPLSLLGEVMHFSRTTGGKLSGRARLSGTLAAPGLDLRFELEQGAIGGVALGGLGGRVRLGGQALVLDLRARQPKGGDLDAELRLALAAGVHMTGSLSAKGLEVGPLVDLVRAMGGPRLDLSGKLDAALSLSGSLEQPRAQGWLQLSEGTLHLGQQQRTLREVTLSARLQGDWLALDLVGRAGNGHLSLALDADLEAGWPIAASATLSAADFPVVAGGMLFSVDLAAKLEAKRQKKLWQLQADVLDGLLRLPKQTDWQLHDAELPMDVIVAGRGQPAAEARPASASGGLPALRLVVSIPGSLRVHDEDLESKLRADLVISLIDGRTAIEGQAELVSGELTLFEQRYDIKQARAVFRGQMPPDPRLDVILEHDFGEAVVFIHLQGTAEKPRLFFSSNPPGFDQAQLMAMVLGRDMNPEMRSSQQPVDIQNQALSAASGLLLSELRSVLKKALPIDTLKVQTAQQAGAAKTEITVGKWITHDLFVAYRYRMGNSDQNNANEALLEYRLGRRWILEGTYGDSGQGGLDVLWVMRF